jgi:hypothetical protein
VLGLSSLGSINTASKISLKKGFLAFEKNNRSAEFVQLQEQLVTLDIDFENRPEVDGSAKG